MTCPYVFIFARTNNHPIHSPVLSNYPCHWFSTALSPWLLRNVFFVARWQQLKSLERRGGPATRPGMQGEVCFLSLGIWSSKGCCWFWSSVAKSQNSTWKGPLGDVGVQNPSCVIHQGRYNMVELWRYTPFAKEIGILEATPLQIFSILSANGYSIMNQQIARVADDTVFPWNFFWASWNACTETFFGIYWPQQSPKFVSLPAHICHDFAMKAYDHHSTSLDSLE